MSNNGLKREELVERLNELEKECTQLRAQVRKYEIEQRCWNIFEHQNVGYFVVEPKGRILEVNNSITTLLGYEKNILLDRPIVSFIAEEDVHIVTNALDKAEIDGNAKIEINVKTKYGKTTPVEITLTAIQINDYTAIQGVLFDVSKRHNYASQLESFKQEFDIIARISSDFIYSLNLSGTAGLEWVKGPLLKITGYSHQEINNLDNHWFSIVYNQDINRVKGSIYNTAGKDEMRGLEYRIVAKNNDIIWVKDNITRLTGENQTDVIHVFGCIEVITQRKKQEQELQQSKKRYKIVSDISSDYCYSVKVNHDGSFDYEWYFGSFQEISGYSLSELQEKGGYTILIHPDDLEQAHERVKRQLNGEEVISELRIITKQGHVKWIRDKGVPEWNEEHSRVERIYGSATDITEQKEKQHEIKTIKSFYENILESAQEGIWVTSNNDTIIYVNNGFEAIAGVTKNEILNKNILTDFSHETTGEFNRYYTKAKKGKEIVKYTAKVKTPAGRDTYQSGWLVPQIIDNEYKGIICTIKDITERIIAENTLLESQERFKLLSSASFEGIFINDNGVIVDCNQKFVDMLGYKTIDEVIGINIFEKHVVQDDVEATIQKQNKDFEGRYEVTGIGVDGNLIPCEIDVKKINYKGKQMRLAAVRDINIRKEAIDKLKASELLYRELFEAGSDAVFLIDNEHGQIKQCNKAAVDLYQYSFNELVKMRNTDLSAEPDSTRKITEESPIVKDNLVVIPLRFHKKKNGDVFPVEITGRFFELEGRKVHIASARDISEKFKQSLELRESEKKYRSLFENMNEAFALHQMIFDDDQNPVDYKFIDVNPRFEDFTGLSKSELIGKSVLEVMPKTEKRWIENYAHVVKTGEPLAITDYSAELDKYYRVKAYSPNENMFAVTFSDVTENKKAQLALEESEKKLQKQNYEYEALNEELVAINKELEEAKLKAEEQEAILKAAMEHSHAGIAIAEVKTGKLKYVNKAGLQITGKGYNEIVKNIDVENYAESWSLYNLDGSKLGKEQVPLARAVLYGEVCTKEFIIRRENNEDRYVLANAGPVFNEQGDQTAAIVVFLDITDKKEAEILLQNRNETLNKLNKEYEAVNEALKLSNQELVSAKNAVEQSESILKAAMENSQAGIAIAEAKTGVLRYVNKAGLQIPDKDYNEVVKDIGVNNYVSSWQLFDLDGKPLEQDQVPLARAVLYGEVCSKEFIVRRKNNEDRYVLANAGPVFNDQGQQTAAIVVFLDITDKKEAEILLQNKNETLNNLNKEYQAVNEALKKINRELLTAKKAVEDSETTLKAAMEHSRAGIVIAGLESGLIKFVNKMGLLIAQFPPDSNYNNLDFETYLAGWHIFTTNAEALTIEDLPLYRAYKHGEIAHKELLVKADNEKESYILANAGPIFNDKGEQTAAIMIIIDITEKINTEKAIKKQNTDLEQLNKKILAAKKQTEIDEKRWRALFNSTTENILINPVNTDGSIGNYTDVNNSTCQTLGYTRDELLKLSPQDTIYINDEERYNQIIQDLITNGKNFFEVEGIRKDGIKIPFEINAQILEIGDQKYVMALSRDISDRKKYEHELIDAKEKAELSDKLKSAFLANMSHEIRTPMNGIVGFSEMYLNPDLTAEKRAYYANIVVESGRQLLSIVNDILDISRIESGEMQINEVETSVNDLVMELFAFFRPRLHGKHIELYPHKPLSDKECTIITDKDKLRQVLNNLLSNALKFTNQGYIRFGYQRRNDMLEFFVKDSGIGIDPDMHETIFDRFRQVELDMTRQYGGTGLGLSISKKIVEFLQGEIWVESELGKGSTFKFNIPYKPVYPDIQNEILFEDGAEIVKKSIVVAEDDEMNYLYIEEVLNKSNYKIIHCHNGQEAVEMCKNNNDIALVLMDVRMPILDGYAATRQIRQFNTGVPIIAQTAYAMMEDKDKALKAGCNDYLSKPIKGNDLIEIIEKHLGHE